MEGRPRFAPAAERLLVRRAARATAWVRVGVRLTRTLTLTVTLTLTLTLILPPNPIASPNPKQATIPDLFTRFFKPHQCSQSSTLMIGRSEKEVGTPHLE